MPSSKPADILSGNPVIRHKYSCDPTAIVYQDTVYLYTGHDEAPVGKEDYVMNEWLCFSSKDMVHWMEHPVPLKAKDFKWSNGDAYASKVIERRGQFYWYVATTHASITGTSIGVAVSNGPTGPFSDALGTALITRQIIPPTDNEKANLDPSVLVDDDGSVHLFWGNRTCYHTTLQHDMIHLDGPIETINLPRFEEGIHIHKRNNWYYLSYGYGMPEKVAYAMSRSLSGPWHFKGILSEIAGNCETNRPCILDFNGKSYFIYHNGGLANGGSHRRSVCIDYLHYNEDDTIRRIVMTTEGIQAAT